MYVSTCTSPFCHPSSVDETGHLQRVTPLLQTAAGKQLSQPLCYPLSLQLPSGSTSQSKVSVTTFHLLYHNVVQKEVPETPDL